VIICTLVSELMSRTNEPTYTTNHGPIDQPANLNILLLMIIYSSTFQTTNPKLNGHHSISPTGFHPWRQHWDPTPGASETM